ncbi:putative acyl-CoA oxidase [Helianthus annuus]|nr:putative acyl-CoA oxidase [Helianthus annuus]KAJ0519381.1 putative acyl-CoA oxidase [Helianthus annuus]KAJ0687386.1 putative acyl-CoA oxidase [Helianthus annuus]KAJ0872862.1 putative acyl-CoA oxidase [Helianthus annuus]KAJ0881053.1 putative acyl-CoA oxidase [Helianthus annuus]
MEHVFTMTCQIAEDLGRAFSVRLVLQTFLDVEATVPYIWSLLLCCNPGRR